MDCRSTLIVVLCFVSTALAEAELEPIFDNPSEHVRYFQYKDTNVLQCNITGVSPEKAQEYSIKWLKNDEVLVPSKEEPIRYVYEGNKLIIHKTRDEDIAVYTCLLVTHSEPPIKWLSRAEIKTEGIPTAKIVSQGTFIEGQKIHLECLVTGKPTPRIEWKFGNTTYSYSMGRVRLLPKNKIPNAVLEIEPSSMSDRGDFTCSAANTASEFLNLVVEASTFVRVKDKLAALWPFIGICAEVVVLCAIIFIYERKRNKAELDESDTDQSPEQKNTPDHGKESVRQRK